MAPQQRTKPQLQVRIQSPTKPFKSSYLAIPPSPFSPRTPLYQTIQYRSPSTSKSRTLTTASASTTTPPSSSSKDTNTNISTPSSPIPSAPSSPLHWLWQCHHCHRTYPLSVTRRCLEDGHVFCAGTTTIKSWRKSVNPRSRGRKARVLRHKACGSEFDYLGWKEWGRWRRSVLSTRRDRESSCLSSTSHSGSSDSGSWSSLYSSSSCSSSSSSSSSDNDSDTDMDLDISAHSSPEKSNNRRRTRPSPTLSLAKPQEKKKDCWNNCDYPSECRWGRQYGVHTPLSLSFPVLPLTDSTTTSSSTKQGASKKGKDGPKEGVLKPENVSVSVNEVPVSNNKKGLTRGYDEEKGVWGGGGSGSGKRSTASDLWSALVASATRRKMVGRPSLLGVVEEEGDEESDGGGKDGERRGEEGEGKGKGKEEDETVTDAQLFSTFLNDEPDIALRELDDKETKSKTETTNLVKDRINAYKTNDDTAIQKDGDGDVLMTSPPRPSTPSTEPRSASPIPSSTISSPMEGVTTTTTTTGPSSLSSTLSTLSSSVTAPVTTLKDMLKKSTGSSSSRSSRSGRSRSSSKGRGLGTSNGHEHVDGGRNDVHHKRAKTADSIVNPQSPLVGGATSKSKGHSDGEEKPLHPDLLRVYREEFAPLERVRSRDSGYASGNGSPTESARR